MHDIWNPWHGCKKCSEGCQNCYMYFWTDSAAKTALIFTEQRQAFAIPCQRTDRVITRFRAANSSGCA